MVGGGGGGGKGARGARGVRGARVYCQRPPHPTPPSAASYFRTSTLSHPPQKTPPASPIFPRRAGGGWGTARGGEGMVISCAEGGFLTLRFVRWTGGAPTRLLIGFFIIDGFMEHP